VGDISIKKRKWAYSCAAESAGLAKPISGKTRSARTFGKNARQSQGGFAIDVSVGGGLVAAKAHSQDLAS
jgi:hypothetical protein